ncbi:hypothetical protein [Anaerorhabdus sp.]|uniref:hypothetical protein n=1 Tax=Anaerorhabdus sp. TaxID=1872524 RepID=UPI002FC5EBE7
MNEFIEAAQNLSVQLLPVLGVIVLIFLCVLLVKLINFVKTLENSVNDLSGTMKLVDKSIEKVQAPLDTAVKLSHTVDEVHDKSYAAVKQAGEYVSENMGLVKNYVNEKLNKKPVNQEVKQDDDIVDF